MRLMRTIIFILITALMADSVYAGGVYTSAMMQELPQTNQVEHHHHSMDIVGADNHMHQGQHDSHGSPSPCSNCHHCLACLPMMTIELTLFPADIPRPVMLSAELVIYHSPGSDLLQRPPILL